MKTYTMIATVLMAVMAAATGAGAAEGFSMLAFQPVPPPVPEPLTILGVCAGVGAVSAYVRKRMRQDRDRPS